MSPRVARQGSLAAAMATFAGLLIGFFGYIAVAQTPSDQDATAASLIGAGVFSAEGIEVGTVAAVTIGQDGRISEIRFTTPSRLGLGERTVAVECDRFVALTGAVVLEMSADEVDGLPVQVVRQGLPA